MGTYGNWHPQSTRYNPLSSMLSDVRGLGLLKKETSASIYKETERKGNY